MKRLFLFLVLLACDSRDYRISRAREFMQNWNYDRAMMELGRIKNNKDAEANFLLGQCYLGKNNYDEAYNSFRQAAQLDTTYIDSICAIYKNLIQKALKIDNTERAVFYYDQIITISPHIYFEPTFLFLIGDIYFSSQNYARAAQAYEQGLKLDSLSPGARNIIPKLIESYEKSNNLRKAIPLIEARYQKTKSSIYLITLGKYYFQFAINSFNNHHHDTAQIYLEKVINSNTPQSLVDDAYFYIGEIKYAAGRYSEAKEFYEKVIRLNPYLKGEIVEKAKARLKEIEGKGEK